MEGDTAGVEYGGTAGRRDGRVIRQGRAVEVTVADGYGNGGEGDGGEGGGGECGVDAMGGRRR